MTKICNERILNERTNENQPTSDYEPFAKSFLLELQVYTSGLTSQRLVYFAMRLRNIEY